MYLIDGGYGDFALVDAGGGLNREQILEMFNRKVFRNNTSSISS